jgi:YD repeat-containing protein
VAWKIGILGLIHDHVWRHLADLAARDDVTLVVADPNPPLLAKARDGFAVAQTYDDYAELIERERPDAVLIMVDNAGTADLVELAAARGIPIMLEKPLADRLATAGRIRAAAERHGVPIMVNWPTAWNPMVRHAADLVAAGTIGEITRFHFRGGHAGPRAFGCSDYFCDWLYDPARNGAGAYVDYCGYGASVARLLLGPAQSATATLARLRQDDIAVDDNAVLTVRWARALALIEASWTAAGPVTDGGPTIAGTTGTLVVRRQAGRREGHIATGGAVELFTPDEPDGRLIAPPALREGERSAIEHFLTCLAASRPFHPLVGLQLGYDTQELLEAGLIAAQDGRTVALPLPRDA